MDTRATTAGWGGDDPGPGLREVGPYRVVRVLGQGGFGVVYEAEQVQPVRRRVALKVLKPGMDSTAIAARFEAESQALAMMDHPCVAKVFDAGVTAPEQGSRPFFVMELVDGAPITDYCDGARLDVAGRVSLMARVCEAVQHAHAKGVVHRDLKPSNILVEEVDGEPLPRVIDFGIAKALDEPLVDRPAFTTEGQLIGTPEYMSPEQASGGRDIDTRSDVYSLGVVLYELLTGVLPFDPQALRAGALAEIQRIIREVEPPKPSTRLSTALGAPDERTRITSSRRTDARSLESELRRDLDWVVMRCLEKDRERRYTGPHALAEELRRYLAGEPVTAGPPSLRYRAGKFVRRNRGAVVAASAVMGALVIGLAGTGAGLAWALDERGRAEERAEAAELAEAAESEARARAQTAERDAVRRLADAEYRAAELAISRGRWEEALVRADAALDAGSEHRRELLEWKWTAVYSQDRMYDAAELDLLVEALSREGHEGMSLLVRVMSNVREPGEGSRDDLLREAIAKGLPEPEEALARAYLAETVPEALAHCDRALELRPSWFHARYIRFACRMLATDLAGAREDIAVLRALSPEDAELPAITSMLANEAPPVDYEPGAETLRAFESIRGNPVMGPGGVFWNDPVSAWAYLPPQMYIQSFMTAAMKMSGLIQAQTGGLSFQFGMPRCIANMVRQVLPIYMSDKRTEAAVWEIYRVTPSDLSYGFALSLSFDRDPFRAIEECLRGLERAEHPFAKRQLATTTFQFIMRAYRDQRELAVEREAWLTDAAHRALACSLEGGRVGGGDLWIALMVCGHLGMLDEFDMLMQQWRVHPDPDGIDVAASARNWLVTTGPVKAFLVLGNPNRAGAPARSAEFAPLRTAIRDGLLAEMESGTTVGRMAELLVERGHLDPEVYVRESPP